MRAVLSVLIIMTGVAALMGCANPSPYAGGYNNHPYYKSADGPDVKDLGYHYTPSLNNDILKQYERAAADMVLLLEQQNAGLPQHLKFIENVYANVPYQTMDYALRQELMVRGYNIYNDKAATFPEFSFSLDKSKEEREEALLEGEGLYDITLSLNIPQGPVSQAFYAYVLPSYQTYY